MENSNYKNIYIETKYLNNMRKNQFLKVKNSHLELGIYFIELKDRESKDRKVFIVSIDDMDEFEEKEIKKNEK